MTRLREQDHEMAAVTAPSVYVSSGRRSANLTGCPVFFCRTIARSTEHPLGATSSTLRATTSQHAGSELRRCLPSAAICDQSSAANNVNRKTASLNNAAQLQPGDSLGFWFQLLKNAGDFVCGSENIKLLFRKKKPPGGGFSEFSGCLITPQWQQSKPKHEPKLRSPTSMAGRCLL
jgi:hypothetical protein